MLATNILEKRTLLSVIPAPPTVAMPNNSYNQSVTMTDAKPFIMLAPYQNESELMEKCGDVSWRYSADMTLGLFYLFVSIVGISENFYVFYQMRQTMKFRINQARASFFIFVGNLAIGDILILTLPIWYTTHTLFNDRKISRAPGDALTVLTVFIHSCCARSSIIFVMFIAVFRVISVRYPLSISKVFSIPRTMIVACLSWVLVVVLSIYSFDGTTANAVYSRSAALCMVMLKDKTNESMSVAGQILAPFLVPGVLTFLALFYLLTFLLRVYNRKMSKLRSNDSSYRPARERDSLIMTVKLTVCFVVFYTPWYIDGILEFNNTSVDREQKSTIFKIHNFLTYKTCFGGLFWHNLCLGGFLFTGSAANPFLYGRTLVHTSQQNVHRGVVQTLYTFVTTHYRRLRGVHEDEMEEQHDVEISANNMNSQIMQQRSKSLRQHMPHVPMPQSFSEKDSTESHELSKHSLLSDQQTGSTSQLVAKSEMKKKELSKCSLTSSTLAHRVEHRERTDRRTKVRVKYSSTREKRL